MTLLKGSVSKHVKAKFAIRNFRTQAASRLVLLHWSILINIITASSSIKTLGFTPVTLLRNLPKQFGCNHNMFKMSDENRLTPNSPAIWSTQEVKHRRVWSCFIGFGVPSSMGNIGINTLKLRVRHSFLLDQRSCSWINSLTGFHTVKYMKSFSPWYSHWYFHYITIISPL